MAKRKTKEEPEETTLQKATRQGKEMLADGYPYVRVFRALLNTYPGIPPKVMRSELLSLR